VTCCDGPEEALGKDVQFVGGAYIEGQTGDIVELYREEDGRHCFTVVEFRRVPDEPAASENPRELRLPRMRPCAEDIRCARVRAGANVRAERRDF